MSTPSWRLQAWDRTGQAKPTVGMTRAVASLHRFDVDGAGNCLEAEFTAVPAAVDIRWRDIVQLQVSPQPGAPWGDRYKGMVVVAGAPRARRSRKFKLLGLKQTLYETPIRLSVIDGADVAVMVDQVLANTSLSAGLTYQASDVPTQGFQLGDRYPRLESIGTFLDKMKETVGSFIVPAGSTYTFDGSTYQAGETVPATRWGVRADGRVFFTRPQGTIALNEADADTIVEWSDLAAEAVADQAALIYASEYQGLEEFLWYRNGYTVQQGPHPIAYLSGSRALPTRRVVLDGPVDHMSNAALGQVIGSVGWSNSANATDGDLATYAEAIEDGGAKLKVPVTWPEGSPGAIVKVRYSIGSTKRVVAGGSTIDENLMVTVWWKNAGATSEGFVRRKWPTEASRAEREEWWVLPVPAVMSDDVVSMEVEFDGVTGCRVHECEAYVVNSDAAARLAQGFLQTPQVHASTVTLRGRLGDVAPEVTLTPEDGDPVTIPVERIEYALTKENGLTTTYYLGQAHEAEQVSQRVALESLARRAAGGGTS